MSTKVPTHLTCWKEIAQYLGQGVRTVQRWERERGLPIHRPPNRPTGMVRALPRELDEWMNLEQPPGGERTEKALLNRIEQLQAENETLRRALGSLLSSRGLQSTGHAGNISIEKLWEKSAQLLMANVSGRHRQLELLQQSRRIQSHSADAPADSIRRGEVAPQ